MLLPVQALFNVYLYPHGLLPADAKVGRSFKFSEASAAELAYKAAGLPTHKMYNIKINGGYQCVKLMSVDDYNFTAARRTLEEFEEFDAEDLPGLRKGYQQLGECTDESNAAIVLVDGTSDASQVSIAIAVFNVLFAIILLVAVSWAFFCIKDEQSDDADDDVSALLYQSPDMALAPEAFLDDEEWESGGDDY